MSLFHEDSRECLQTELDLFSVPMTQTTVESGQWVEYTPVASIGERTPLEFMITSSTDEYINLNETMMKVTAKITRDDGENSQRTDHVGPCNNFMHSLFSQLDVLLNDTLVSSSTATYPYRAYIETLLNYGKDAKETKLTAALYYEDTAGQMDETDSHGNNNMGLKKRSEFMRASQEVDMMGPIHSDLFFQNRYLLSGMTLRLRFIRSGDSFCLMGEAREGGGTYSAKITSASVYVRKVRLSPSVALAHERKLATTTAKYPIDRVECKVLTIAGGQMDFLQENLFLGQLPKRVVLAFVETSAYNGSLTKNPFNFKHFDLNNLSIHLDGQQVPWAPLTPNFHGDQFVRSFFTQFTGGSKVLSDSGHGIDRTTFKEGYAVYCFDLTPDLSSGCGSHFNLVKQGNLRLRAQFTRSLAEPVNVIVYAEFDNLIEIDRHRNVVHDYRN